MELIPTEEAAEAWLIKQRWPDEICCCKCGSINVQHVRTRKPQPFRCRDCRRHFSVRTDTLMHNSPLPLRKWIVAIFLVGTSTKGLSSRQLAARIGISVKSAWHVLHRIRENFSDKWPMFEGTVEADESHIGGKFRSMHAKKRRKMRKKPNYGKTIVVGARERETGQVVVTVVSEATQDNLLGFLSRHVSAGSQLYTDDSPAYGDWPGRETVCHSTGEYVRGDCHTNGIESFWALLKRKWHSTHHWWSTKHMARYINECAGILNLRGRPTLEVMGEIVRGMDCKRLPYRDLVQCRLPLFR